MLSSAALGPRMLEVKGVALARAVDRQTALIADVEPSSLDLVLVSGGVPQKIRTLSLAPDATLEDRGSAIVRALRQTVDFHNSQTPALPLLQDAPLYLVGPESGDQQLRDLVASETGHPLAEFEPGIECPPYLSAADYAVNLGLAMRKGSSRKRGADAEGVHPVYLDLEPPKGLLQRAKRMIYTAAIILIVGVAANLALAQVMSGDEHKTSQLRLQQRSTATQVTIRRNQLAKVTKMEADIAQFKELVGTQGDLTQLITEIRGKSLPVIEIDQMAARADNLTLSGQAANPEVYVEFLEVLEQVGQFSDVTHGQLQPRDQGVSISAKRKGAKKR